MWKPEHHRAADRRGLRDLPPNFHPAMIRVIGLVTALGAGAATGGRQSCSGLRRRSPVAVRLAAWATRVR